MPDSNLKQKRKAFCCNYVMLGNVEEAAVKAGFEKDEALLQGVACLESSECRKLIAKLRTNLTDSGNVSAGLKRLAFGNCSDAVYLVFADELPPSSVISGLDLFNVSEIKRVKGGGVEVKLFDRQKALEKLFEFENSYSDRSSAESLIEALTKTAEGAAEVLSQKNKSLLLHGGRFPDTADMMLLSAMVRSEVVRRFLCRWDLFSGHLVRSMAVLLLCAAKLSLR